MPLILPGNVASATAGAYDIANSVRMNSADTAYFAKTPSAGDRAKWTFSVWFKIGNIPGASSAHCFFSSGASGADQAAIKIDSQVIHWWEYDHSASSFPGYLITNRKIRDPSAWYHLVCTWDSDNGTAGNRMRMYINGTEETSFSTDTNPTSGFDSNINSNVLHEIGRQSFNSSGYFDGYFAEMAFCDGQAYAASDFGEFSEDSPTIWMPKDISGLTFGTRGWYLDFEDSADLDDDESGNGNDWTLANLAAADQMLDTPTNNFCVLNALTARSDGTLSQGNLLFTHTAAGWGSTLGTFAPTAGKWYWESRQSENTSSNGFPVGIYNVDSGLFHDQQQTQTPGHTTSTYGEGYAAYTDNGDYASWRTNNVEADTSFGSGDAADIWQCAIDLDNQKIWFGQNNTWTGSGDPANGTNATSTALTAGAAFAPITCSYDEDDDSENFHHNFGADSTFAGAISAGGNADGNGYGDFVYAPPSGFLSLCTKNLGSDGG